MHFALGWVKERTDSLIEKGEMMEELLKRKQANVETVNELRQLLQGREPLEGGDDLYIPANSVPIASDVLRNDDPYDYDYDGEFDDDDFEEPDDGEGD